MGCPAATQRAEVRRGRQLRRCREERHGVHLRPDHGGGPRRPTITKYATEKELLEGVETIPGTHRLGFTVVDTIPTSDKRDNIPWRYTITAIDAKKGITVSKERDGKPFIEKEPKENSAEEEPLETGSGSGRVPAGVFASAAMVSLGLWLAGRRRVVR